LTTPTPTASYSQNADGYERVINVIHYSLFSMVSWGHRLGLILLLWSSLFTMVVLMTPDLGTALVTSMVITVK